LIIYFPSFHAYTCIDTNFKYWYVDILEKASSPKKPKEKEEEEIEEEDVKIDYEQWKKQILKNARKALKEGK
jgi:NACalpha-BTF3-like transcription factor